MRKVLTLMLLANFHFFLFGLALADSIPLSNREHILVSKYHPTEKWYFLEFTREDSLRLNVIVDGNGHAQFHSELNTDFFHGEYKYHVRAIHGVTGELLEDEFSTGGIFTTRVIRDYAFTSKEDLNEIQVKSPYINFEDDNYTMTEFSKSYLDLVYTMANACDSSFQLVLCGIATHEKDQKTIWQRISSVQTYLLSQNMNQNSITLRCFKNTDEFKSEYQRNHWLYIAL